MSNTSTSGIVGLLTAAVMYTAIGLLAGLIYTLIAPALSLPSVGIPVLLGVWWLWFLFIAPVVVFYVSVFRATDPLAKLANAMSPKEQEKAE